MKFSSIAATTFVALSLAPLARAQANIETADAEESKSVLGVVTITSSAPTSMPSETPATTYTSNAGKIARSVNATDAEDALKYFPSLLVRKRYIGDYNHAVLSSRASGTGNSARSAVFSDGMLLSNYLGNGAAYAPRWMLVTPEDIDRVSVMYGPFSAAYPGNSVGAVVDFVTRMPDQLEVHAKTAVSMQPFRLYETDDTFYAHQESLSVGDRSGSWAWWANFNHTDSHGQPLTFPTRLVSAGTVGAAGTPVAGAVLDRDRSSNPWYLLGTATEYRTLQDHGKIKLAYDLSPLLRASYTFGLWQNSVTSRPTSYLRDAGGNPVYSGNVNIGGRSFALAATDYNLADEQFRHFIQGLSIKSHAGGRWDWEAAASLYAFSKDLQRQAGVALPAADSGGGTITDQSGTGWSTLAIKGVWRPSFDGGTHVIDVGLQQERYALRMLKSSIAGHWRYGPPGSLNTNVGGNTRLRSLYVQDAWAVARPLQAVLGVRIEQWGAFGGYTATSSSAASYDSRSTTYLSPKASLSWQVLGHTVLKASVGRAVRMPTVNELYGATTGVLTVVNDPGLRPEKSWTGEVALATDLSRVQLRATAFHEVVRDSLYSERIALGGATVTRITNIDRIATPGLELALQGSDWLLPGLDLQASLTWADSRIRENSGYVMWVGDTIGKYQPRVPRWRAAVQADARIDTRWTVSLGMRYSGVQYSTLDNSDSNGYAYQGASPYCTADLRVRYQFASRWHAAVGVDNLGNYQYWNFHPYPRRTYFGELQYDW